MLEVRLASPHGSERCNRIEMGNEMKSDLWWVLGIALSIPVTLYNALALAALWSWFIAPLGVPTLTVSRAVGVQFVVSFILASYPKDNLRVKDGHVEEVPATEDMLKRRVWVFLYVTLALAMGWCWHKVLS